MNAYPRTARRRAGVGVLLAVLAAVAAGLAAPSVAVAHPGPPSPVFDPLSVSWRSLRDYNPANFNVAVANALADGLIPIDIDADAGGATYVLGAVFQRNLDGRDWRLRHGLTNDQYEDAWDDAASDGFRLVDFETYVLGGVRFYNGLWVENVEGYGWVSMRNMTQAQWVAFRADQHDAGRIIIDVDHYAFGAGFRYAAAAVTNDENLSWEVEYNQSLATFNATVADYYDDDFRLLVVDSVQTPDGQRFTGIFVRNVNGRSAPAHGQLTAAAYHDIWADYLEDGLRPINQERYETVNGTRYLGVWRQND